MANIDTIVFDFGGVLIDWNPRHVFRQLFEDEDKMEWFLSNVCTDEWNVQQDKGRLLKEGTALLKASHPAEHHALIEAYYGRWEEMLKGEISETVEILHELRKTYKVYGLTNWSAETFPIAQQRFPFLQVFDGIVVSGEEKLIKPDPAIFHLLTERYGLKPEHSVFIDDNSKNVAAARTIGFEAIQFTTADELRSRLRELKLL
ncbi:MAG: HAD family phosphatase [Williamsia sp.]|nr:HAD family phosphatase [Williamsia sp.]